MPLICPVCGSHVCLPEHGSLEVGITLSHDDKENYYLEIEKESSKTMKAQERIEELKRNGVDTSCYFAIGDDILIKMVDGTPTRVDFDRSAVVPEAVNIAEAIETTGDVFNAKLDGRWIMAQMFHMLRSTMGYTEALKCKGYNYQWDFICGKKSGSNKGEIYRLMKRERDGEDLSIKSKFFNGAVVASMITDYVEKLKAYISLKPVMHCGACKSKGIEGAPYIRLGNKYRKLTKKPNGDIFIRDIDKLYRKYMSFAFRAGACRSYSSLYTVVEDFKKVMIALDDKTPMSDTFVNVYKANGSYYTLNNMIRFHDCNIRGCNNKKDSIKKLDNYAKTLHVFEGYKLLGMLRDTIEYNHFSL